MLNYGYGILQSEIQIRAVVDGYDPTIGILHDGREGEPAFIFDLMEPHRAQVDRKILRFVRETEFDQADFTINQDGVCRLNPEMAKVVVSLIK